MGTAEKIFLPAKGSHHNCKFEVEIRVTRERSENGQINHIHKGRINASSFLYRMFPYQFLFKRKC